MRDFNSIPFDQHFKKSKDMSPVGYRFMGNTIKADQILVANYISDGYILLEPAYNVFGEEIEGHYAIYKKGV